MPPTAPDLPSLVADVAEASMGEARGFLDAGPYRRVVRAVTLYARISADPDVMPESKVTEEAHLESVLRQVRATLDARGKRALSKVVRRTLELAARVAVALL